MSLRRFGTDGIVYVRIDENAEGFKKRRTGYQCPVQGNKAILKKYNFSRPSSASWDWSGTVSACSLYGVCTET